MSLFEYKLPEGTEHFGLLAEYESPADLLRACEQVRDSDIVARLGGDEFGVILRGCDVRQASEVALPA